MSEKYESPWSKAPDQPNTGLKDFLLDYTAPGKKGVANPNEHVFAPPGKVKPTFTANGSGSQLDTFKEPIPPNTLSTRTDVSSNSGMTPLSNLKSEKSFSYYNDCGPRNVLVDGAKFWGETLLVTVAGAAAGSQFGKIAKVSGALAGVLYSWRNIQNAHTADEKACFEQWQRNNKQS